MTDSVSLGNKSLLEGGMIIGFFASSQTSPGSVLPTLDWAYDMAKNEENVVMSGFQSPLEKEVLEILLQGSCGIIMVLNRSIYRKVPERFSEAMSKNRLLFISLESPNVILPSKRQAARRNEFIASTVSTLVFSSVAPTSSLYPTLQHYSTIKPIKTF